MNKLLRGLIMKFMKTFPLSDIVGKRMKGINKRLFFEPAQHLTFLFRKEIEYETNVQSKVKDYIKNGDIIFDIGGNIGQYAMLFSELAGKEGKVYSFEPDFKNFSFLQFNSNINKCDNLLCYNYGVGATDSKMEFFRDTETGGRCGSFIKDNVGQAYKGYTDVVKLKRFDTLIAELGEPDFIKIDVEGFEVDVLKGLSIILNNSKFLVEVREETKEAIYEYFAERGFACLCIDNGEQPISRFEEIPKFANLIFSKTAAN